MDITLGDVRIVILIHLHEGKEFLWPVLRQTPSDSSVTGILGKRAEKDFNSLFFDEREPALVPPVTLLVFSALQPVAYEELQHLPKKLKIDNQEIEATRCVCQTLPLKC